MQYLDQRQRHFEPSQTDNYTVKTRQFLEEMILQQLHIPQ